MHAIKTRLWFIKFKKKSMYVLGIKESMSFKVICIFKLIFFHKFFKFDLIKRYYTIGVGKNKVAPDELK